MSQFQKRAYQNDSVGGAKVRLENNTALRARNAANSADIALLTLSASDEMQFGPQVSRLANDAVLANTKAIKGRNAANSADLSMFQINASDEILAGAQLLRLQAAAVLPNATYLKGRNQANSADVNIIELNTSNNAQMGVALDMGNFELLNSINALPTFKVKALVTTNVTVSNPGTAVFDGVTLTSGQFLALTGQTDPKENGVWTFNTSGTALTRPTGWTTGRTVVESTLIVTDFEGTTYGNQIWSVEDNSVVGTDNIGVHTMSSGGGGSAAGPNGSVQLSDGSGNFISTADLFFDDGNNYLGIGTNTPAALLHATSAATNGSDIFLENTDTGAKLWQMISTGSANTTGAGIFGIINQTDDSANYKLLILPTGEVGIGTNNPSYKLTVNGTIEGGDLRPLADNAHHIGAANFAYLDAFIETVNLVDDVSGNKSVVQPTPSLAADTLFQLPPDNGTNNFVLKTDGTGVTSWVAQAASPTFNKESFTLNGTDITNQYTDLAHVAKTGSIHFGVVGLGPLFEGPDYSVSYTGGAGGNTRITWLNDIATGGGQALISGDVVKVAYAY